LPKALRDAPIVAQAAVDQRLDVQMQRAEVAMIGTRAGFTNASSFINAFHIAAVRNSATGSAPQRGYELELPIPVFDWGDARRAQYFAEYTAASQRLAQTLIEAESSVREQYAGYRASYSLATHYRDEIVPLRKMIADETLLRYNGMLLSVFDLLAATRSQIGSVILAIDAERDFWLADAALQATLLGKPMTSVRVDASPPASADAAAH
jgi:outer membrane protein TolC